MMGSGRLASSVLMVCDSTVCPSKREEKRCAFAVASYEPDECPLPALVGSKVSKEWIRAATGRFGFSRGRACVSVVARLAVRPALRLRPERGSRTSHLRKNRVPWDLQKLWLGHANN